MIIINAVDSDDKRVVAQVIPDIPFGVQDPTSEITRPNEPPPDFNQIQVDDSGETNEPESEQNKSLIRPVDDDQFGTNESEEKEWYPFSAYEEAEKTTSVYDDVNKNYNIDEKISLSISGDEQSFPGIQLPIPLKIVYVTLKGSTTERIILPSYIHSIKAISTDDKHNILVAWCTLRKDWRKFIISSPTAGIKKADLVEEHSAERQNSDLNSNPVNANQIGNQSYKEDGENNND